MLLWQRNHTDGLRKMSGFPSAAFAQGFSLFASNALFHELWALRLNRPLNRRAVAAELALSTLDEIESSEPGVENALRLLRCGERKGWWSHLFGTAQSYPDNRPDDDGDGEVDHPDEVGVKFRLDGRELPAGPYYLSLWDILRTFRANPAKGWDTDLEVENPDYGVLRFIDRAVDIHELGDDVRTCSGGASTRWPPTNPSRACPSSEGLILRTRRRIWEFPSSRPPRTTIDRSASEGHRREAGDPRPCSSPGAKPPPPSPAHPAGTLPPDSPAPARPRHR